MIVIVIVIACRAREWSWDLSARVLYMLSQNVCPSVRLSKRLIQKVKRLTVDVETAMRIVKRV